MIGISKNKKYLDTNKEMKKLEVKDLKENFFEAIGKSGCS